MAFSQVDFYQTVLDVEKYLGYVKGNELCVEYLRAVEEANAIDYDVQTQSKELITFDEYRTPCPDGQFEAPIYTGLSTSGIYMIVPKIDTMTLDYVAMDQLKGELMSNLDKAWNNGSPWSEGIYEYVNDVSRQFVKPDVEEMAAQVHTIASKVVEELSYDLNDDWLNMQGLVNQWTGQGGLAFQTFYANFNDVLARFCLMSGHVAAGFGAGTRIINGYQQSAMEFVGSVRQNLKENLEWWVSDGRAPHVAPPTPGWIADAAKIVEPAYELLKLIPGAAVVTDPIDAAKSAAENAKKLIEALPTGTATAKSYEFKSSSADGIYKEFTDTLYNKFYLEYDKAMQEVHSGPPGVDTNDAANAGYSAQSVEAQMLKLQGDLDQWELPSVPPGPLTGPEDEYPG